mmetsp:Transcript_5442/g.7074  ORF Transcript_5442/g.7074 Transcript_5442/m.7074 type:complete len:797 (-) Transcript_5442:209-2599(-)
MKGTWITKKDDKDQTTSEPPTDLENAPPAPDDESSSRTRSPRARGLRFGSIGDDETREAIDKEANRMKKHRQTAKNMLINPTGYIPVALDEVLDGVVEGAAAGAQKVEFEFENLVNDSDMLGRNTKCEIFGKYGQHIAMGLQSVIYIVGFLALLTYSVYVNHHSATLSAMHTVMPVMLHCIGVGASVIVKIYYDFSKEVGHLESMHLIIRSRMWLFPGVLGVPKIVKRSIMEAKRKLEVQRPQWDDEDAKKGKLTFNMTHFLQRCQFPEFRCLFRAYELYPWSQVSKMKDTDYADRITKKAQDQIMRVFPILDVLDVAGSIPAVMNPINWVRLTARLGAYLVGADPKPVHPDDIAFGSLASRAEEIEEDDMSDLNLPYIQRSEPLPWATVRLTDFHDRFKYAVLGANLLGVVYYFFSLSAYLIMVFGEVHFYSRLDIAFRYAHPRLGEESEEAEDDENSWSEDFAGIHGFAFFGCILMFLALPFGMQASALMAENAVAPMLVIQTVQAHVANFTLELDQYLTLLAVNKGSHSIPDELDPLKSKVKTSFMSAKPNKARERAQDLLKDKVSMTRDMALSWRMGKFFKEVEHTCEVINISVGLMVLNFICHLVPMNVFLFDPKSCIPLWVILFSTAQMMSLFVVIKGGIESNEMVNEGIDQLLHNWQLKFNMIGWSGGFIQNGENDEVIGFVAQDPPGETKDEVELVEKEGDPDYGAIIKAEQQQRIQSIVKVLAHYEAENITPFSVLGVTVTRDMLTLVVGFFGGSIVGVISSIIDNKDDIRAQFMCHRILDSASPSM